MQAISPTCTAWTGEGDCNQPSTHNIVVKGISPSGHSTFEYTISRCEHHTAELQRRLPGIIVSEIDVEKITDQ